MILLVAVQWDKAHLQKLMLEKINLGFTNLANLWIGLTMAIQKTDNP